jgi:ribonuclease HIII
MAFQPYLASAMAGHDEYLGHLVVASIAVNENAERALLDLALRRRNRRDIGNLKEALLAIVPCEIITVSPKSYNKIAAKNETPEAVTVWAMEKSLANLLKPYRKYDKIALVESAPLDLLKESMDKHGHSLSFDKEAPKKVLAAAQTIAIISRQEKMVQLSEELGVELPMKASEVESFARAYLKREGKAGLSYVAKLSFSLTAKLLQ